MPGSRPLEQLAAKKRLILLFSTVLALFFARLGMAGEPLEKAPDSVSFEDFLTFESASQRQALSEMAPGCSSARSSVAGPQVKPMLGEWPVIARRAEPQPDQADIVVLGGTGYNYLRDR